jgi:hypothetical protein
MRTQDATSGAARGEYVDLQQYDQKLRPSPLVPRKKLKKEAAMNQAFIRGFFDELEKQGSLGSLLSAGTKILGKVAPQGGKLRQAGSWLGGQVKKDPMGTAMNAMQAYGMAKGVAANRAQGSAQHRAALSGQAPVTAKKKTGLMAGLGFKGAV